MPAIRRGFLPKYWETIPPGRLIVNLPTGTIITAMPAIVIPTPKLLARIGIDGAVAPCPNEFKVTHKQRTSAALYLEIKNVGLNVIFPR